VLERLEAPMNVLDDQLTGSLTPEQIEALLDALGEIRESLEKNAKQE
jgi:hypothetical protein